MKTKSMTMFATFALAALGFGFAARGADANGHIRSIDAVPDSSQSILYPNPTAPLKVGQTFYILVRLLNEDYAATMAGQPAHPWYFKPHVGIGAEELSALYLPKLGISIGGRVAEAVYSDRGPNGEQSGQNRELAYYTDLYFAYTVKPGDLGLPVKLLRADGQIAATEGNNQDFLLYNVNTAGGIGMTKPWDLTNDSGMSSPDALAGFHYGLDNPPGNPSYPSKPHEAAHRSHDLEAEGIYVQTVDFDDEYADKESTPKIWREVYKGDDSAVNLKPTIVGLTNAVVYVWSADDAVAIVEPDGAGSSYYTDPDDPDRKIVQIAMGSGTATFKLKGTGAVGDTVEVFMSSGTSTGYSKVGDKLDSSVCRRWVKIIDPPEPFMSVTTWTGETKLSVTATTNYEAWTLMKVAVSQAYTNDEPITVNLNMYVKDVPLEEIHPTNGYVKVLLDENDPTVEPGVTSVTIPAGETAAEFYLYALGGNAKTKSNGIVFAPVIYDPAVSNFYANGNHKTTTVKLDDQVPQILMPTEGSEMTAREGSVIEDFAIAVADNWRDLQPSLATNGYTVSVAFSGGGSYTTNCVHFKGDESVVITPIAPNSGTYDAIIKVKDPAGHTTTRTVTINANPKPKARVQFYTDENMTKPLAGNTFAEDQMPYVGIIFSEGKAPANMYAFLVPTDANATNLVECDAKTNGLKIVQGDTNSTVTAMSFVDGYSVLHPMKAKFDIVFKNVPELGQAGAIDYTDDCGKPSFEVNAVNVKPTVTAIKLDTESIGDGGTFFNVPIGIAKPFRARVSDPSAVDLLSGPGYEGKEVWVRWEYTDGFDGYEEAGNHNLYSTNGVGNYAEGRISFTYENTTQRVRVYALDKDDRAGVTDLDALEWGDPCLTFYVKVADSQRVIIHGKDKKESTGEEDLVYLEDQMQVLSANAGDFYISLSDKPGSSLAGQPGISKLNPVRVKLTLEQYGDGHLDIQTNYVYFTSPTDMALKPVRIDTSTLNGGLESVWFLTAEVDMLDKTAKDVDGYTWAEHYAAASCVIRVENVDPKVDSATAKGNRSWGDGTNTVSVGESVTVNWRISDITNDFAKVEGRDGFQIEWTVDSINSTTWPNPTIITNGWARNKGVGTKGQIYGDYQFAVPDMTGYFEVKLTATDGDGGRAEKSWWIYIAPSKRVKVNVFGPKSTAQSKYKAAKGVGQGFVAAKGTMALCEQFVQTWEYDENTADAELYAWGYPATDTWAQFLKDYSIPPTEVTPDNTKDEGKLPGYLGYSTLKGVALNKLGNKRTLTDTTWYDWATHGGTDPDAGKFDSFFYRWVVTKAASNNNQGGGGQGGETEELQPAPTTWAFDPGRSTFMLDAGQEKQGGSGVNAYGTIEVEAVFAKEWRVKDNLGDINADGIPDKIVELYGIGAEEVGGMPADDLAGVADFNDDEDYLPNSGSASSYSKLIPDLPETWGEGLEFMAKTEVRGYGDGLNDGAKLAGVPGHRLDADFNSDDVEKRKLARDYSDLEMLAWAEHGYDKNWSPERPTDPTKADTDDDKIPDGYEYYFWYQAHVGYMEGSEHRYLTGRRYDPRNPGEGKLITSAMIARMTDPRSDLAPVDFPEGYVDDPSAAKTRDSDNDGLPDMLEFELGTNPFDFDSDGDGLPDGFELMLCGTDPLISATTPGISDAMRNFDGDAMAFTTPTLETELVLPVRYDVKTPYSFALVDEDGDTDGIQWYVTDAAPEVGVLEDQLTGTVFRVGGQLYVSSVSLPLADGRIARDLEKSTTWTVAATNDLGVSGTVAPLVALMPTWIPAGTKVTDVEEEAEYATLRLAGKVKDANTAWVYGKGGDYITSGEGLANIGGFGMLAISRYQDAPADQMLAAVPQLNANIAYIHYMVYQEFGFDPRTAWNAGTPLAPRWGVSGATEEESSVDNIYSARYGYAGISTRTREFTLYDEFLVMSFFLNNGKLTEEDVTPTKQIPWERIWSKFTTNGQGPAEPNWLEDDEHYKGRTAESASGENGADTDMDGVPDGWELYVMTGPKDSKTKKFVFAGPYNDGHRSNFSPFVPLAADKGATDNTAMGAEDYAPGDGDGLTELQEYAGTDSCAYYCEPRGEDVPPYSETIVRPAEHMNWFNKFFPTDPWDSDTDEDGISDGQEFGTESFIYGTPADDGKLGCIPGGGLNPCTVDTDLDGLPDPWERRFKGRTPYTYDNAVCKADGKPYITFAEDADGNEIGNALQGLTDGMDGTVWDAYTFPLVNRTIDTGSYKDDFGDYVQFNSVGIYVDQVVDRDYDHDGLENWQEYLTGAMRCWRYDDPVSRWDYFPDDTYFTQTIMGPVFDAAHATEVFYEMGYLDELDENEFWYKSLFDETSPIYNPHFVTDTSSGSMYFSRVKKGFDLVYTDEGAYYIFCDRIGDKKLDEFWGQDYYGQKVGPKKYICCSPIKSDTDQDGMDDYYELFHGMNPLLGYPKKRIADAESCDIVFDSWYGEDADSTVVNALKNIWISNPGLIGVRNADGSLRTEPKTCDPDHNNMDFELFPWLSGLDYADPDGDDIRNQAESIMPKVAPSSVWLHTDPTPLWMTDTSYTNSYVHKFFRLPARFGKIMNIPHEIVYDGVTYPLCDRDGYMEDPIMGPMFAAFQPDFWELGAAGKKNWIVSFEENEGYDSDHDAISDYEELQGNFRGASDPQDFDSPHRRQAMYFPGKDAALQSMPFVKELHPRYAYEYPDDLSFLQYTVECWARPESDADATLIERAIWTDWSNPGDEELLRRNFQIAIKDHRWYTKFDSGTLGGGSVEVIGSVDVEVGKWTHLAATYDAGRLVLYVNGASAGEKGYEAKGLMPESGAGAVIVHPATNRPFATELGGYRYDREFPLYAFLIGASFRGYQDVGFHNEHLDVTQGMGWSRYKNFYTGYLDEIRVWDGARSQGDIKADMKVRYTAAKVKQNRDDFYDQWAAGKRRYKKDDTGNDSNIIPELRFHWSFDSIPGAANAAQAAKVPHGFGESGAKAPVSRPETYEIGWWSKVLKGYTGTVYGNPAWVQWVPNTVTHLPRYDGTTLDSAYWGDDYTGGNPDVNHFAHTAEPVSRWSQYVRNAVAMIYEDGSTVDFQTTGHRFWHMNAMTNATIVSNGALLFEFTGRHLNQMGDDLLPLGGAFVKYVDAMWDENGPSSTWEISGDDTNNNQLPDWWEKYAKENYLLDPEDADHMTWETIVDYHGRYITAGEAYLYDLAKGYYVDENGTIVTDPEKIARFTDTADEDKDGMYDWWETLMGIHSGSTDFSVRHDDDDPDNDGLSNYQEFMASEIYDFYKLNPMVAQSHPGQLVTDYYLSVPDEAADDDHFSKGEYLGEVFTDHDFMEDWWENKYAKAYSNAKVYDPWDDTDGDGWSNFGECRAFTWSGAFASDLIDLYLDGSDENHVKCYPQPAIGIKVTYDIDQIADVTGKGLVVRTSTTGKRADATFCVKGSDDLVHCSHYAYGYYDAVELHGFLNPGRISPVGVAVRKAKLSSEDSLNWNYIWYEENLGLEIGYHVPPPYGYGTFEEYRAQVRKYPHIELESGSVAWEPVGVVFSDAEGRFGRIMVGMTQVGTVDFRTGEYTLDMTKMNIAAGNMTDYIFAFDYQYRIGENWPQTLWLSETMPNANDSGRTSERASTPGRVKEGLNTIEAFIDLNGNGLYDIGEPYGVAKNVPVGWHKVPEITIELTDESTSVPRTKIGSMQEDADASSKAATAQKVRIVRESINGQTDFGGLKMKERTVLAKAFVMDDRAYLTEADVLSAKRPDLDWQYLNRDALKYGLTAIDYVTYRIEAYEELPDGSVSNTVIRTFTREFASVRPAAATVSPKDDAPVYSASPTFRFTAGTDATAFEIQVARADDNKVIYDSGIQLLGGRSSVTVGNSAYAFTAPIYANMPVTTNGAPLFADGSNYQWRVVAFNAKYNSAASTDFTEWRPFQMDVANANRYPAQPTGYGRVAAAVRYFGPARTNDLTNLVVVEAFANADFTGQPLAQTRLADLGDFGDITAPVDTLACTNAVLNGVDTGTVYLRAFIDLNNNGKWDKFEPWGYANMIGEYGREYKAAPIYNPRGLTVGASASDLLSPSFAPIYIEDTDWNKNEKPDCLELELFPETTEEEEEGDVTDWWFWAGADKEEPGYAVDGDVMAYAEVDRYRVVVGAEGQDEGNRDYLLVKDTAVPTVGDAATNVCLMSCYKYGSAVDGVQLYGQGTNVVLSGDLKVKLIEPVKVALVHNQVYQEFPYDMRTANPTTPESEWTVAHTKPFTAIDKKLLPRYFEALGLTPPTGSEKYYDEYLDELAKSRPSDAIAAWNTYSLKVGDPDQNRDGITDGWQLYVMFSRTGERAASTPWTNIFASRTKTPGGEGLNWAEEFENGHFPTDPWTADTDGDGVTDYYARFYHLKGDDAREDFDGDGLSNYAEYLISEVFCFAKLDPDNPKTDGSCIDYFRKVGDLYLGEVFTDHDQVGDVWEADSLTEHDPYVYNPKDDPDNDGWSNYAEFRAGTDPMRITSLGVSGADGVIYTKNEYPIPVVEAKVVYNGQDVNLGSVVFKAWSETVDPDMTEPPDAIWTIGNGDDEAAEEATGPSSETGSSAVSYRKYVGRRPAGVQRYALGGGSVLRGSVTVRFLDQNYTRTNVGTNQSEAAAANWYVGVTDKDGVLFDFRGNAVGTVDYGTGILSIDFSKLSGTAVGRPNTTGVYEATLLADPSKVGNTVYYDNITLDAAHLLIGWSAVNVGLTADGTYYLADANRATAAAKSHGHVREGLNTFICFTDEDGDGLYTPGEPFGVVRHVDVGWDAARFTVTLTRTTAITPRITLWAPIASDREATVDGFLSTFDLRNSSHRSAASKYPGTNDAAKAAAYVAAIEGRVNTANPPEAGELTRIRVVRYGIDTLFAYQCGIYSAGLGKGFEQRVVMDKTFNPDGRVFLSEQDFLGDGLLDLDWDTMQADKIVDETGKPLNGVSSTGCSVTNMTYLIVLGDGKKDFRGSDDTNTVRALSQVITRRFEKERSQPVAQSVGIVHAACPTFTWTLPGEDPWAARFGTSYTAFKVQILDAGNDIVYDSGVRRLPAQNSDGSFTWTADACVDDLTALGNLAFARTGDFSWHVSMYNAKFRSDYWSELATFSTAVNAQQGVNDNGYSAVKVAIKYAGPSSVLDRISVTGDPKGKVRVQAFRSADFSGEPVSQACLFDKASAVDLAKLESNVRLIGLPAKGTYFIRAYVDMNGNRVLDDWESWGCAKEPVVLGDQVTEPSVGLFIEDADTDNDLVPDGYEYAQAGWKDDFDDIKGVISSAVHDEGKILFTAEAYFNLTNGLASLSTGLPGASLTLMMNQRFKDMIVGEGSVELTADEARALVLRRTRVLENSVRITAFSLDPAKKMAYIYVDGEVETDTAGLALMKKYDLEPNPVEVEVKVYMISSLAEKWPAEPQWTKSAKIGTDRSRIDVDLSDIDFSSGFFKVEIVK